MTNKQIISSIFTEINKSKDRSYGIYRAENELFDRLRWAVAQWSDCYAVQGEDWEERAENIKQFIGNQMLLIRDFRLALRSAFKASKREAGKKRPAKSAAKAANDDDDNPGTAVIESKPAEDTKSVEVIELDNGKQQWSMDD